MFSVRRIFPDSFETFVRSGHEMEAAELETQTDSEDKRGE